MKAYADHGSPGTPVQKAYDDAAAGHAGRRRRRRRPRRRLPRARGRGRAEVRRLLGRADRVRAHASSRTRSDGLRGRPRTQRRCERPRRRLRAHADADERRRGPAGPRRTPRLLGPGGRERGGGPAGLAGPAGDARGELVGRLAELRAELARPRASTAIVLCGMGGSSLAPGGHLRHRRRPARSCSTPPTPARCRAAIDRPGADRRRGQLQVRRHGRDRQPAARVHQRASPRPGWTRSRSAGASSSSPTPARRCRRPPPTMGAPRGRSSPTRPSAAATARCRRSGWCRPRWPARTSARCSTTARGAGRAPGRAGQRRPSSSGPRSAPACRAGRDKLVLADGGLGHRRASATGPSSSSPSPPARRARGILPVVVGVRRRPRLADADDVVLAVVGSRHPRRPSRRSAVDRAARRAVPRLGVRHRGRRPGPRDQPVRPAERHREQGEHPARSSPTVCPTSRPAATIGAIEVPRQRRGAGRRRPVLARRRDPRARRAAGARSRRAATSRSWPTSTASGDAGAPGPAGRRSPRRTEHAGHVRLGAALPALHRPVPQGRPAGRRVPAGHRRGRRGPRGARTRPFTFGTPAGGPGRRRPEGPRRPGPAAAAPAPDRPRRRDRPAARWRCV